MKICSALLDLLQEDKWTDRQGEANKDVSPNRPIHCNIATNSSLHPLVHRLATAEQSPYPALCFENVPYSVFQLASLKYGRSSLELDFSDLMHVLYIPLSNRFPPFIQSHMLWGAHRGILFKANVA